LLKPRATKQFKKDRKKAESRGVDIGRLDDLIDRLVSELPLPKNCRPHPLRGDYEGHMECHIGGDWLLIWYQAGDKIVFVRTGSHSDLFE
jgi:mRNA interferase YafQ